MKKTLLSLFLGLVSLAAFQAQAQTYCTTSLYSSGTQFGDEITIFSVGSFTKNSTGLSGGNVGFADFTADTIMLNQSLAYNLAVTYNIPSNYSQGSAVWIDYNDDGDFDDPGEHLWSSPDWALSHTGSLTISGTADTGYHRLRVRCNFNGTVSPTQSCALFSFGEVEDYTVYIGPPPPCPPPLFLSASSVTATTATISWQSSNNSFDIEYGPVGFTQGTGDTTSSATNSVNLTGLTANTSYDIYVLSDCSGSGNGISTWAGPFTFTTLCSSIATFPNTEDFNDTARWQPSLGFNPYPDVIDNCWDRSPVQTSFGQFGWVVTNGPSNGFNTGPNSDRSGSGQYIYANSAGSAVGDSSFMSLPLYDLSSLTNPLFTFYTHMYGATTGSLLLQVSSNGTSWTTVYSLVGEKQDSANANWSENLVDLTQYKNANTYIRFVAISGGGNGDMAIDDVTMEEAPPCPKPTATTLSNITSSSVTINFISTGASFPIEYGPSGYNQGTGMTDTATATGHILSGLAANSAYDIYIQNDCSGAGNGLSAWAGPFTFRTLCDAYAEGYFQNFDGVSSGNLDPCWSHLQYGGSVHTVESRFPSSFSQVQPVSTPNLLYWYNAGATWSYVVTPEFVGLDGDSTQIRFKMTNNYFTNTTNINVFVGTMSDREDTSTIVWHDTILTPNRQWTDYTILLDNGVPAGHKYVVFGRDNTVTFAEVDIENFYFEGIPQCLPPTSGSAQATSSTSISVSWVGPGTSYDVEYGVQGFTQGTGSIDTNVTSPYAISGLNSNTCYDVYVRNNCGAGSTSPWFGPITICTPCNPQSMPYTEDFTNWEPNCFIFDAATAFEWEQHPNGHAQARFWSFSSGTAFMTTGPISITQKARVKFKWAKQYNAFYPDDRMIVLARVQGAPVWDTLIDLIGPSFTSPNTSPTVPPALSDFVEEKFNLDSATYFGNVAEFQFVAVTDFGPNLYVDDFVVEAQPLCTEPDQVTVNTITGTSANLDWNTSVGSQFEIEYGPQGFVPGTGVSVIDTATSAPYVIAGLTPVTCYDVYIRTLCGANGNSIWTGPIPFCTTVSCPPPTNVTLLSAGQNSASFSWTTGSASSWNYVNVGQGLGPGVGTPVFNASIPSTVTGLAAGTAYSFWVRDSCGPGDVSTWAGPFDYVTPLCDTSQQCDYTVYMHDSFGDGWNSYEFGIAVGSVTFNTFGSTFTTGFEDTATFSACNGYPHDVTIQVTGGFAGEVSFEIVSSAGDTVYALAQGSLGTTSPLGSFTPNCLPISCPVPDMLSASSITATSANLNWNSTGNNFQVSWGQPPFAAGSGTIVTATTNSYPLTGLMGNSQYGYYVREICTVGDTSLWNGPYTFFTLCTTNSLPFYDNMDGVGWTPDDLSFSPVNDVIDQCWNRDPSTTTYSWRVRSTATGSGSTGPNADYSGTGNYIYTEASYGSAGNEAEIVSPAIDLSTAVDPYLRFAYLFYGIDINKMYIEGFDGTTWSTLDSIVGEQHTTGTTWSDTTVSLMSYVGTSSFQFRMRAISDGCCSGDMAIDEFTVFDSASVACPGPTNVAISAPGCDSLVLSWTSDMNTLFSTILWDTAGFNPLTGGMTVPNATSPLVVKPLVPGASYDFYVIDSCSTGISAPVLVTGTTATGPLPVASFTANPNASTHPDTVQFGFSALNSSDGKDFMWDYGDNSTGSGVFTVHDYTMNGTYTVTLIVSNGCGSDTATQQIVVEGIDIEESMLNRTLNVFPNPTDGAFTVSFSVDGSQDITLRVMDALGRILDQRDLGRVTGMQTEKLDLSGNASGIYLIQIESQEGTVTKRITLRGK